MCFSDLFSIIRDLCNQNQTGYMDLVVDLVSTFHTTHTMQKGGKEKDRERSTPLIDIRGTAPSERKENSNLFGPSHQ